MLFDQIKKLFHLIPKSDYQRILVVGDLHEMYKDFHHLLYDLVQYDPQKDFLILLGDYIDKGNRPIETIEAVMGLCQESPHVIALRGNHEEMMVASVKYRDERRYWLKYGGVETLQSFGGVGNDSDILFVPSDYISWLKGLKPYHETENFIFCHATPLPHIEMKSQPSDGLRWRFIPNDIEPRHCSGKTIICGHSAQKNGKVLERDGIICIDTYSYGEGNLTALEVESMTAWQVPSPATASHNELTVTMFPLSLTH